jgi:hypothetical protein
MNTVIFIDLENDGETRSEELNAQDTLATIVSHSKVGVGKIVKHNQGYRVSFFKDQMSTPYLVIVVITSTEDNEAAVEAVKPAHTAPKLYSARLSRYLDIYNALLRHDKTDEVVYIDEEGNRKMWQVADLINELDKHVF